MNNIFAVARREVRAYLYSPIAYIVGVVFTGLSAYTFYAIFLFYAQISQQYAGNPEAAAHLVLTEFVVRNLALQMCVFSLLILPMLTMRSFAEEKKQGTIELLLTSPIAPSEIVYGKFLATATIYGLFLVATFALPVIMSFFGTVEWPVVFAAYLGLVLVGFSFIAIGNFTSTLTENQVSAALISFGLLLVLWIIGWLANSLEGEAQNFTRYLSLMEHFQNFAKGVVDTRDVLYFVSVIVFGTTLTRVSLESLKWRL